MSQIQKLSLSQIEAEPLFDLRFQSDERMLLSSLQKFGLNSVLTVYEHEGRFFILDGGLRFRLLKQMNLESVDCRVYTKEDLSYEEAFLYYFELNSWSRKLNLIEKTRSIAKALEVFKGRKIPFLFWDYIDVKKHSKIVQYAREILNLPETLQKYIVNNDLSIKVVLPLLKIPNTEVERVLAFLCTLPMNQNRLLEVLSSVIDISRRDQLTPWAVLESAIPFLEKLESPQQKEKTLRQALAQLKNPLYNQRLSRFQELVGQLNHGRNTKIVPAPYFEEDYVEVVTRFSDSDEIEKFIQLLQKDLWRDLLKEIQ